MGFLRAGRTGHAAPGADPAAPGARVPGRPSQAPADTALIDRVLARRPVCNSRQATVGYRLHVAGDGGRLPHVPKGVMWAIADAGVASICGTRKAWLALEPEALLAGDIPFSAEDVVLTVDVSQELDAALVEKLRSLQVQGFTIALDGFRHRPGIGPLLAAAGVLGFDLRALGHRGLRDELERIGVKHTSVLASGVVDHDAFLQARRLAVEFFEGPFITALRPREPGGVPTRGPGGLGALSELCASPLDLEELERIVSIDAGLSYRLLRFLNSAYIGARNEITSVRQALIMLGETPGRRWLMLCSLAEMSASSPALLEVAVVRARACELLGAKVAPGREVTGFFVCGLFSVLEALVGRPFPDALDGIPLPRALVDAIVAYTGPEGEVLDAVMTYEAATRADVAAGDVPVAPVYRSATAWVDELLTSLPTGPQAT